MKSTFIVMAASALIAVSLYAKEVDVTGSSPSAPASPADNAFEVMAVDRPRRGMARHLDRP